LGVVHCDLKPANILFTADGHAKIADFGIAHVPREMFSRSWATASGFVAGTLPYMSPEQADGVRDDPRADLYALGAVLYRMLTGRTYLDFDQRDTPGAQARNVGRIQTEQPQPPSVHNRRVPAWLDAVVLRALAKRSAGRHANAGELLAALARKGVASSPPVLVELETVVVPPAPRHTSPPTPPKFAPPMARPQPAPLSRWLRPAIGGTTALLVVAVIVLIISATRPSDVTGASTPHVAGTSDAPVTSRFTPSPMPRPQVVAPYLTGTSRPEGDVPIKSAVAPTSQPQATTSLPPTATIAPTATVADPTTTTTPTTTAAPSPISSNVLNLALAPGMTLELVRVPTGEFLMGSNKAVDPQAYDDELPQHKVTLPEYWIGKTEVTNAQYATFVSATGQRAPSHWPGGHIPAGKDNHPVAYVSWDDAVAFCAWASRATGRVVRLPSEAEWEKAARGTDARLYPWGNAAPDAQRANFGMSVKDTTPVGQYPAGVSPYGALDMTGNVWEWTNSLAKPYPYDARDGRENANDRGARVLRGGAFDDEAQYVQCAHRDRSNPVNRPDYFGFRVASPGL
jgi:serine/threonine-protein kinase